jgi:nitroimidazol reductase NimA-like FMN-containing flavoprotein (pyridoxamine 5'-phosphate oxidase superfamily)
MQTSFHLDPGDEWLDNFFAVELLARVATIGKEGPHITPVAFCWLDSAAWICSQIHTRRFVDLHRDPRVALVVEATQESPARYVEILGNASVVGEVPCVKAKTGELLAVEERKVARYGLPHHVYNDGIHAWVRTAPRKILHVRSVIAHHDEVEHLAARTAAADEDI